MSYSTNAAGVSKYTAERHQRILQDLLQQPGNDVCADCKSRAPRWSSWNLGIFICVQCASIHRKIGTHVTKVKSVNLDAWTKEQIESMKTIGNIKANAKWNPNESTNHPPTNMEESERDSEMEKYIRAKYETKKFMDRKPSPSVQTSTSTGSSNPYRTASTSASSISAASPSSTTRPSKAEGADPSQTVRLGFGRESRVEFSLTPGGGDMFDGIVQQNKMPQRSRTAPIPEPAVKEVKAPAPPLPTLSANVPSRSLSTQPPSSAGAASGLGVGAGSGMGMTTAVPTSNWGDMMALQTGGPLPSATQQMASPMQQGNPYALLSLSPSLPSTLSNRMNQTRSFTAPVSAGAGPAPNPFFPGHQQQPSTGSSMLGVPTGGSFGSVGSGSMMSSVPTGGSFGSMGSGSFGGMGTSPGGAFGGSPFGSSTGGSLGVSTSGAFGASPNNSLGTLQTAFGSMQGGYGTSPSGFNTSMMSPPNSTQAFSPPAQQPSPFQQNTQSPFGMGTSSNLGSSPGPNSLSAFGAAMSPGGGQASNSPFMQQGGMSNSPYAQANMSTGYQAGSSPFQSSGAFQQPTPTSNALFLQPNSSNQFQQSSSPFQQSNSPFPNSNSPYQTNPTFTPQTTQNYAPMNTNPFGTTGGGPGTNPFGAQQQQQFQAQFQGQGWNGM